MASACTAPSGPKQVVVHPGFSMCANLEVSIQSLAKNDPSFNGGKSQVLPQDTFLGNLMPVTPCGKLVTQEKPSPCPFSMS